METCPYNKTAPSSKLLIIPNTGAKKFCRLITNESAPPFEGRVEAANGLLAHVRQYLAAVVEGDGKKPYCPFVNSIEKTNSYYVITFKKEAQDAYSHLVLVSKILEAAFKQISPAATFAGQQPDFTTVIAAFANPDAGTQKFCLKIEEARNNRRQRFLKQGLMLAHMTPYHALGSASNQKKKPGDKPLYVSETPLLVVRRMHKEDHVFMNKSKEKVAYEKFFGKMPSMEQANESGSTKTKHKEIESNSDVKLKHMFEIMDSMYGIDGILRPYFNGKYNVDGNPNEDTRGEFTYLLKDLAGNHKVAFNKLYACILQIQEKIDPVTFGGHEDGNILYLMLKYTKYGATTNEIMKRIDLINRAFKELHDDRYCLPYCIFSEALDTSYGRGRDTRGPPTEFFKTLESLILTTTKQSD